MILLSFDIEISDVFDLRPYEDINKYSPFHVCVASTVVHKGEEKIWYSTDKDEKPFLKMTKVKSNDLLIYLSEMQKKNYMVCAWNGLGFDLRWIGYCAQNMALAAEVALNSYDPMFQFFNQRGFPVSLAKVAEAMGIKQAKLMTGADAPKQWRAGNYENVIKYVLGDSQITNKIVATIIERRKIDWVTQKNEIRSEPVPKLKTVEEILKEPEPDQSWMRDPLPRSKYVEWFPEMARRGA